MALPDISTSVSFNPKFSDLYEESKKILKKEITPSKPIQELLNDALLQSWVKTGMVYHRNKRQTCGFCRQPLPDGLWEQLDAHFSKESSDLEAEIQVRISSVEDEIRRIEAIPLPKKGSFYTSEAALVESESEQLANVVKQYSGQLSVLLKQLKARQRDIFKPKECPELTDYSAPITARIEAINRIIDENNKKTGSLPKEQQSARNELRLDAVAAYIKDIELEAEERKIAEAQEDARKKRAEVDLLDGQIKQLETEIEGLRVRLQDEKKGSRKS